MNKNKKITIVALGILALVIVTTTASFAYFTYSRVGVTKTTITTGDLEFRYIENKDNVTIIDQYPLADSIGASDENNVYNFEVGMNSSSALQRMKYNVIFIDNNKDTTKDYFKNNQIKYSLSLNGTYVADTKVDEGKKLSTIDGFTDEATTGEGAVLEDQEIVNGQTHNYKLRIWISDDVNYSNTVNNQDEPTSNGSYNSYMYSLKVKVTANTTSTVFDNLNIKNNGEITVDVSDSNGLKAYALTNSKSTPQDNEWIDFNTTAKTESKVKKVGNITSKSLTLEVDNKGTYYLHVKNSLNQISRKTIEVKNEVVKTFGLYDYIKENADKTTTINFSQHSGMSGTNGIYTTTATESGKEVYYYRGKVDNNLIFGGFCWSIVRTTETGGVKLIYNGIPTEENGKQVCKATGEGRQIGKSAFNSSYNDNAYVGYMYGTTGASTYNATHTNTNNSTMKTYLEGDDTTDGWFKTSGLINYLDKIEDTPFCNDRNTVAGGNNNSLKSSDWGTLGYGTQATGYGALARSVAQTIVPKPSLKCINNKYTGYSSTTENQNNDKFTVSKENGNGRLKYPVGLITLDEAVFAGFNTWKSNTSNYNDTNNYLNTGYYYWTLSTTRFYYSSGPLVGVLTSGGSIDCSVGYNITGVRPVISLIFDTQVEEGGTGTQSNPYVVK